MKIDPHKRSLLCLRCRDQIQSSGPHDFVRCGCGAVFIDSTYPGNNNRWGGETGLVKVIGGEPQYPALEGKTQ